jgi:hypothetical protein
MWLKLILFFSLTAPAWGYKFTEDFINGFYWQTLPINIMVADKNESRKAMLESLALAAITEWEDSTGLSLWDYTGSGTRNIIRWSDNFAAETRMDPSSVLAVAIRYTNGPYFARTEIVINGNHNYNYNQSLLRTTLTHELGHTMGLDHSEVGDAVMAPTLQPWYMGLHQDDIQGVQAAFVEMDRRQVARYVSPLAYETEKSASQPLSCATVGSPVASTGATGSSAAFSLISGILISFVRKVTKWFKSYL